MSQVTRILALFMLGMALDACADKTPASTARALMTSTLDEDKLPSFPSDSAMRIWIQWVTRVRTLQPTSMQNGSRHIRSHLTFQPLAPGMC